MPRGLDMFACREEAKVGLVMYFNRMSAQRPVELLVLFAPLRKPLTVNIQSLQC